MKNSGWDNTGKSRNWMDNLARAFATESSRRGLVRGLFVAAAGGGTKRALAQEQPVSPDGGENSMWLPVVQGGPGSPLCPVASTCDNKKYCSDNQACRCLMSAEGVIRCGQIPGCNVPKCETSADCAHLGEGYFCDTPYSGCCSDGELARCIAPCTDDLENCPAERRCGYSCCGTGEICYDGRCRSGEIGLATGTWQGDLSLDNEKVGIRFVMQQVDDNVVAQMYYIDPVLKGLQIASEFEGEQDSSDGYIFLAAESGSVLDGYFSEDGNSFEGKYHVYGAGDEKGVGITADAKMTRSVTAAAEIELAASYY